MIFAGRGNNTHRKVTPRQAEGLTEIEIASSPAAVLRQQDAGVLTMTIIRGSAFIFNFLNAAHASKNITNYT
jgi:hypothetical protein